MTHSNQLVFSEEVLTSPMSNFGYHTVKSFFVFLIVVLFLAHTPSARASTVSLSELLQIPVFAEPNLTITDVSIGIFVPPIGNPDNLGQLSATTSGSSVFTPQGFTPFVQPNFLSFGVEFDLDTGQVTNTSGGFIVSETQFSPAILNSLSGDFNGDGIPEFATEGNLAEFFFIPDPPAGAGTPGSSNTEFLGDPALGFLVSFLSDESTNGILTDGIAAFPGQPVLTGTLTFQPVAVVPLPASLSLFLSGMGVIAFFVRRSRRNATAE